MNNAVTVSNNSEVTMFTTSRYGLTIILLNKGVSNVNKLLSNTITMREKEGATKGYHVSEMSIVADTTKAFIV